MQTFLQRLSSTVRRGSSALLTARAVLPRLQVAAARLSSGGPVGDDRDAYQVTDQLKHQFKHRLKHQLNEHELKHQLKQNQVLLDLNPRTASRGAERPYMGLYFRPAHA